MCLRNAQFNGDLSRRLLRWVPETALPQPTALTIALVGLEFHEAMMPNPKVYALQPHVMPGRAPAGLLLYVAGEVFYDEALFGLEPFCWFVSGVVLESRIATAKTSVGNVAINLLGFEVFQGLLVVVAAVRADLSGLFFFLR